MKYKLNICHLYPDLMDTYGDTGNIITIQKRCEWRSIKTSVTNISVNEPLSTGDFDFYFFGGGQDKAQEIVSKDITKKAESLIKATDSGAVLLSICGGYQLLQNYFKTKDGKKIGGIGIFDAYTKGSDNRMIQNLIIEIAPDLQSAISKTYPTIQRVSPSGGPSNLSRQQADHPTIHLSNHPSIQPSTLIGFENHSGKTYLGKNTKALGTVIKGSGNNGADKTEGAVYKNAFGCYLHGSLLPKNPHFADYLISKALERRHGIVKFKPLDDSIEWQAHNQAADRSFKSS